MFPSNSSPGSTSPLLIEISANTKTLVTSRAVYTVLDFLGDIGGLMDALKFLFGAFVTFITQGSYMNRLISLLFYYRAGGASAIHAITPYSDSMAIPASSSSEDKDRQRSSLKERTSESVTAAQNLESFRPYSWCHIFAISSCFSVCFKKCCPQVDRRDRVFSSGERKIGRYIDIVRFMRNQMLVEVLFRVLFKTRVERYLARK